MDSNTTSPFLFRSRIEIINQQTKQLHQCLIIPNPYANVSAQIWANPSTQEAVFVIDGKPLSEPIQAQIMRAIHSPEMNWVFQSHENVTDPLGKVFDGVERGHTAFEGRYELKTNRDSLTIFQRTGNDSYKQARIADNYKNNGSAIIRPNPDSPHSPGSKKYRAKTQPISPGASRTIRKAGEAINSYVGSSIGKGGKLLGLYGDAIDAIEVKKYYDDGDYNKAKEKVSGMVGGKLGARSGAALGAEAGMALPIPHPVVKVVVVVVLSIGGGIAGAFGGEKTGKWLYSVSDKLTTFSIGEKPEPLKAFPTDINTDRFNVPFDAHLSSQRLYDLNQDIIGYSKRPDGTLTPIRRSDLGDD